MAAVWESVIPRFKLARTGVPAFTVVRRAPIIAARFQRFIVYLLNAFLFRKIIGINQAKT
jgi:hypothetical protein